MALAAGLFGVAHRAGIVGLLPFLAVAPRPVLVVIGGGRIRRKIFVARGAVHFPAMRLVADSRNLAAL